MAIRHGQGGIISWNGLSFILGRSKPLGGVGLSATTIHSISTGSFRVDRRGKSVAPMDYTVQYEYLCYAHPSLTNTLHDAQTQYDAIINLMTTSPVGTLVTFGLGDSSDHISGLARLESAIPTNDDVNFKALTLTFFCEAGMS